MHEELLAVVNEHDQITDYRPRRDIHANGLRHRAVHILVFNQQGCLFLQKRSLNKDTNQGLWDSSAAGHVDKDESYDSSASRELVEELGVSANLTSLFKLEACAELGMEFVQVYRCRHNGPFTINPEEIDEGDWFSTEHISSRVSHDDPKLTDTFKAIWKRYQEYLDF